MSLLETALWLAAVLALGMLPVLLAVAVGRGAARIMASEAVA